MLYVVVFMESACEWMGAMWNVIMMEEYETKQQYLRHLKRMGEIRDGSSKLPLCNATNHPHSSLARTKSKDLLATSRGTQLGEGGRHHTSTQRIMREFTVEKENTRLMSKILNMSSIISLRKYQQDYKQSKRFLTKTNKPPQMVFTFFDIRFAQCPSLPQDSFTIYLKINGKKVLIAHDSLFELRKREFKFKRSEEIVMRVKGKQDWGTVRVKQQESLIDIRRSGQKVGHVVVEHIK